jgi:hypothetical protein
MREGSRVVGCVAFGAHGFGWEGGALGKRRTYVWFDCAARKPNDPVLERRL